MCLALYGCTIFYVNVVFACPTRWLLLRFVYFFFCGSSRGTWAFEGRLTRDESDDETSSDIELTGFGLDLVELGSVCLVGLGALVRDELDDDSKEVIKASVLV